jgi:hypothetical protein
MFPDCEVYIPLFCFQVSTMDAIFGGINPTATSVPWPPQFSRPRKFQPGPLQCNDVGHPDMRCGHWELRPNNPRTHSAHERTSVHLTQVHLNSHNSSGGINRDVCTLRVMHGFKVM